jgi:RND family efflux transporter MFP subunit
VGKQPIAKAVARFGLRVVLVVVVLIAIAGIGLGVASWAGMFETKIQPAQKQVAPAPPGPLEDYVVDEVHPIEQAYYAEAVGTLKAASRTEISARVMAEIQTINVRAGDVVEKDDVVIELDRAALERRQSQAEAALADAKAAVDQARADLERAEKIRQANPQAISKREFDQLAFQAQSTEAKRDGAKEALAEVEVLLSYTTIKAPKAGTIVERFAEPGDVAQPGRPLLELYDPTSLRLEVPVMENLAIKLTEGDELTVNIDALDRTLTATVDEIVPQAEAASRSFLVKVKLPPSPDLFEGMYGRLMIPAGKRLHLCLNAAAVEKIGQLEFVYAVDDDGENPERRYIKTGRYGSRTGPDGKPGRVEVLSGLEAGEKVLVKAPDAQRDDQSPAPQG